MTGTPAPTAKPKKPGGGAATGGGISFQAAVTAIAGVHLLRGSRLSWLPVADIPVAVWAESEGAGDDVRLELLSGDSVEIQAKKGLHRGSQLWDALEALIVAVNNGHLAYGVLAVAPDSSRTICVDLANDVVRLGEGRSDNLTDIGTDLLNRLQLRGSAWAQKCKYVRIHVVHALEPENAEIKAAKEALRWMCADDVQAEAAWDVLCLDAVRLIKQRGRWDLRSLITLLKTKGITIRDADFPAAVATKLSNWVHSTARAFTPPGSLKPLPLSTIIKMSVVETSRAHPQDEDAPTAFYRYHNASLNHERNAPTYDAEWIGRFRKLVVVVAGPGLGKSTLMTLLANAYAADGFPVFNVKLKAIAAAMELGNSFDHALRCHALDGSGITPTQFDTAGLKDLVVLADGLDDCGANHKLVAQALAKFAAGHPAARIVITTRPIGYTTTELVNWTHYRLLPPDKTSAARDLAGLINALREPADNPTSALGLAEGALNSSPAASSSPLLLGMAAVLIASKGKLPSTRPQLYSDLVGLYQNANDQVAFLSSATAVYVLNALGWLLMQDSLVSAPQLAERCAKLLAEQMGCTLLAASEQVGQVIRQWEVRGIIEQLHHDRTSYWTFIHKTFTEFTAARHLMALPIDHRARELSRLVDQPEWHEVIGFACGLGLGDDVARLLVERRASGHSGQMERALKLAGDPAANVTDQLVKELVLLAFEAIKAVGADRFTIGLALAELADVRPAIVNPIAVKLLYDKNSAVQLVAWACAVACGPQNYGVVELTGVLDQFLSTISRSMTASLFGGIRINTEKDSNLVERIAFTALAAQPDTNLKDFAESLLSRNGLGSVRFHEKVESLLRTRGISDIPNVPKTLFSLSLFDILRPTFEWRQASANVMRALANAVVAEFAETDIEIPEQKPLVHFSALLALTGFNKVPANDVYCWEEPFDTLSMRVVMQAMVQASAIDPKALSAEATAVLRATDADYLSLKLPQVDVSDPDWHKAAMLMRNRDAFIAMMNHGSKWMACVAGNILAASSATVEQSRSLLNHADGKTLWAATEVVREQQTVDVANALILGRLAAPLTEGAEHLFGGLVNGKIERSAVLDEIVARGFAHESHTIAIAAANLAKDLAERGQPLDQKLIIDAYDDWLSREPDVESGVIPPSPCAELLKLLVSQNLIDDGRYSPLWQTHGRAYGMLAKNTCSRR